MQAKGVKVMKVVILAGGQQSTLSNKGEGIPKPMLEIGGKPLLWHIMKHFSEYNFVDFVVCGGYRIELIKEYFMDFYIYDSDITVDLALNSVEIHKKRTENWKVTIVDTGLEATPGERILAVADYLAGEPFIVTYGDCLSDVDVDSMVKTHNEQGKLVTMVMAKPQGRKQLLTIDENGLLDYDWLSPTIADAAWVSADCFVMDSKVLGYLSDETELEEQVFHKLSRIHQVATYCHEGFWTTVETKRDLVNVEKLWEDYRAPWIKKLG